MAKIKLNEESMDNYKEFMDKVDWRMMGVRKQLEQMNMSYYEKITPKE